MAVGRERGRVDGGYGVGTILRLAKSPPELFPTHRPTRPVWRSLSWRTTRLGCFASATNTLTCGLATTTRTWNQAFGSGAGLTGCSYSPGCSALSFCHGQVGWETYCTARLRLAWSSVLKLNGRKYTASYVVSSTP